METRAAGLTPLRELALDQVEGCRVLSHGAITWRDGSEDRLLEIVRGARDLSSLSDELEQAVTNWPERYHLAKSRANVLRPFSLNRELTVLEVGAGCGAITRYLGETCGIVDALEPVLERARVARSRTRDLENVEVWVGEVDDLPTKAAYDLVVVVGVLEYVGEGSASPEPYVSFLAMLARVLRPGGHLICAIENRLGVKYLAGSPEDHTGRVFDGLEGYPRGGPARTFARKELAALFEQAGLQPTFLHAFPDYKLTRAIFSDSLLDSPEERSLAWRLPHFPSPDWMEPRPRLVDERSLWKTVVEDGLGGHFSNSFVIVASTGPAEALWPPEQVASFYNCQRRALFATQTHVRRSASGLHFVRSPVAPRGRRVDCGPLVHEVADSEFVPGRDLLDVLASSSEETLAEWLQRWRSVVARATSQTEPEGLVSIELGLHNFVVRDDGELVLIDQEWWHREYKERQVIERSILWLALFLADRCPPERWQVERVGDLARKLGAAVGLEPDGEWLSLAVAREAALQAEVHDSPPGSSGWESSVETYRSRLQDFLDRKLTDTALGMREHELRASLEAKSDLALTENERQLREVRQQLETTTSTVGFRLLERARRVINRSAPPGTRRRSVLSWFWRWL
ncbi:MAG: class I SAM-dependent methyltransferase [Chloroflexi bacterium]|nr:class I SAM-dependent methyltransferase [Chloroflexota bacterium]